MDNLNVNQNAGFLTGSINNQSLKPVRYKLSNSKPLNSLEKDSVSFSSKNDASCDNNFTLKEAGKNFLQGIISPIKALIKHPVATLGIMAATVGLCALVPIATPILTVGFGLLSLYEMGKGGVKAYNAYKNGNLDSAEKAFEEIGTGFIGTVLTAFGLKPSAAVAAEAKAAQVAETWVDAAKKAEIVSNIKSEGLISALKENLSVFTTSEGRNSIISQLKPSSIKNKFNEYKELLNKKPEELNGSELTGFANTVEGQRRAKLRTSDLEPQVYEIFEKSCNELGIPKELRPKLVIKDELKYATKEEIEAKVTSYINEQRTAYMQDPVDSIKIFDDANEPLTMTKEQISSKIKTAVQEHAKKNNQTIKFDDNDLYGLMNEYTDGAGGCYQSSTHTITYYPNSYRRGYRSIEEVIAHEATHTKEALLRSRLQQSEQNELVKEILLNRIKNGEPEEILKTGSFMGPTMMKAPKMSPKMKNEFVKFAEENLYQNNTELLNDLKERNTLKSIQDGKHSTLNPKRQARLAELETKLQPFTNKLEKLINENPEFVADNGGNTNNALTNLLDYSLSHETRFQIFTEDKVKGIDLANFPPLSEEEKLAAIESTKDYITSIEGNSRIGGFKVFGPSKAEFNQYQFSPEEVLARNTGANFEKRNLQAQLDNGQLTQEKELEITERIKILDFQIEYNNKGQQYYEAYTKLLNNPDNKELLAEVKKLETEFNKIESQKTKKEVAGAILNFLPSNLKVVYPLNVFPRYSDKE